MFVLPRAVMDFVQPGSDVEVWLSLLCGTGREQAGSIDKATTDKHFSSEDEI